MHWATVTKVVSLAYTAQLSHPTPQALIIE